MTYGAWVGGVACGSHVDAAANGTAASSEACGDEVGVTVLSGDVVGDKAGAAGNGVALCPGTVVRAARRDVQPLTHDAWVHGASCGAHVFAAVNDAAVHGDAYGDEISTDGRGVAVWPGDVVGDEVGAAGDVVALCSGDVVRAARPGVESMTHSAWVGGAACSGHVVGAANDVAARVKTCGDKAGADRKRVAEQPLIVRTLGSMSAAWHGAPPVQHGTILRSAECVAGGSEVCNAGTVVHTADVVVLQRDKDAAVQIDAAVEPVQHDADASSRSAALESGVQVTVTMFVQQGAATWLTTHPAEYSTSRAAVSASVQCGA
eukprot:gene6810-5993_t